MSRRVFPSWKCKSCNRWTPHGKYTCQHCGANIPQYPDFSQRAWDGSIPPPEDVKQGSRDQAVSNALAQYAHTGGLERMYDDVASDDRMPED